MGADSKIEWTDATFNPWWGSNSGAAMANLPLFNKRARCPKCSFSRVDTLYFPEARESYARSFGYLRHWPDHEFLRRTCQNCKYEWAERCHHRSADAIAKEAEK